jgi:hypothetical protein
MPFIACSTIQRFSPLRWKRWLKLLRQAATSTKKTGKLGSSSYLYGERE